MLAGKRAALPRRPMRTSFKPGLPVFVFIPLAQVTSSTNSGK